MRLDDVCERTGSEVVDHQDVGVGVASRQGRDEVGSDETGAPAVRLCNFELLRRTGANEPPTVGEE